MADEMSELPEVPTGDSLGEENVSETPAQSSKLDLTQTEEWRNAQSAYDRQIAAERRARQLAEQEAERLRQQAASLETVINTSLDPDQAAVARASIVQAAQEAELQTLRASEWRRSWAEIAREKGVDPTSADFQSALNRALQVGHNGPVETLIEVETRVQALRAELTAKPKTDIVPHNEEETVPKTSQPSTEGYVAPPAGRAPSKGAARIDAINAELIGLMNDYTKNKPRITQLRAERDKLESGG